MFSVRDVAAVTDGNLYCMAHLRELREKAIAWISAKEGSAVTDRLAELSAAQQAEIDSLRRQVAKLSAAPRSRKKAKRAPISAETRRRLSEIMRAKNAVKNAPKPPPESENPSPEPAGLERG
jgi:hypothetical protein